MVIVLGGFFGAFVAMTGLAFLLSPSGTVTAFGIDPSHMADLAVAPLAGIRSLIFGVLIAVLALQRERRALSTALLLYTFVSAFDFSVAAKAFGVAGAWRHLIPGVVSLLLGFVLQLRRAPA